MTPPALSDRPPRPAAAPRTQSVTLALHQKQADFKAVPLQGTDKRKRLEVYAEELFEGKVWLDLNQNRSVDRFICPPYPVVKAAQNGDLYLIVRADDRMNPVDKKREGKLYRWDNANEAWSVVGVFAGETNRAVYPHDVQIDSDGNVHILYEWSLYPSGGLRHELSYIQYKPATGVWVDHAGSDMSVPVDTAASDTIRKNEHSAALAGNRHGFKHRRPARAVRVYKNTRFRSACI